MMYQIKPRFKVGDKVLARGKMKRPKDRPVFFPAMNSLKNRPMVITNCWLSPDKREFLYGVEGNPHTWAERWLNIVKEVKPPKFKEGDWVIIKESINDERAAGVICPHLHMYRDDFNSWKHRPMRISHFNTITFKNEKNHTRSTDQYYYSVDENRERWAEEWLEKIKFDYKKVNKAVPRFKLGEWVKLKQSINSPESAQNMSKEFFRRLMLSYKNRFMKIRMINRRVLIYDKKVIVAFSYHVKENDYTWPEAWLEKVE
jgi:hypothetical protein